MTQQPTALRLADELDYGLRIMPEEIRQACAAELRRLHEVNEELLAREKRWMELADIEVARCDKLQAINAQLLEALEEIERESTQGYVRIMLRDAIKAAKEQA